jgi:hypothetical protein
VNLNDVEMDFAAIKSDPTAALVTAAASASEEDTESDDVEYMAKGSGDGSKRAAGNQKQTKRGPVATRGSNLAFHCISSTLLQKRLLSS